MAVLSRISAVALALAGICTAVEKRDLKAIDSSYDYIVVGGGVSGLVVANRLTEDSDSTCRLTASLYWRLADFELQRLSS